MGSVLLTRILDPSVRRWLGGLAGGPDPSDTSLATLAQIGMRLLQLYGRRAARCWHPANLGVLGHAWSSSSRLRTGLKRMQQYWRIVSERSFVHLKAVERAFEFCFERKRGNPRIEAIFADMHLSMVLDMCRLNTGASLVSVHAALRRSVPLDPVPYRRCRRRAQ
jgi:Arabinose-binding domain of AraC transcription regulator, N-term